MVTKYHWRGGNNTVSVVPQPVAKLANGYNLLHFGYSSLQGVAIYVTAQCTTYSFSELQSQQYSLNWLHFFCVCGTSVNVHIYRVCYVGGGTWAGGRGGGGERELALIHTAILSQFKLKLTTLIVDR